jgi:hypothetical protein
VDVVDDVGEERGTVTGGEVSEDGLDMLLCEGHCDDTMYSKDGNSFYR